MKLYGRELNDEELNYSDNPSKGFSKKKRKLQKKLHREYRQKEKKKLQEYLDNID